MGLVILLAIGVPIAEIWTAIQVAHHIGGLTTIALLILISISGPWLVRRAGTGVWRRARQRLNEGDVPGREAIDGVLLLLAGSLLTFPGFITGALGVLLLFPPVRTLVRVGSAGWLARRVRQSGLTVHTYRQDGMQASDHSTLTAESHPVDRPRRALDDPGTGGPPPSSA